MPKERVEFERAKECSNRGFQLVSKAIALTPRNESAWSYKTNILLEFIKLAEMSRQVQHKRELLRQYDEALKETTRVLNRAPASP